MTTFRLVTGEQLARKKRAGLCAHYRCGKTRLKDRTLCARHRHWLVRERDPGAYTYHNLRQNARRRGKFFDLTLAYWRDWCEENDYLALRGRSRNSASVDCFDPAKGYTAGNLRILTVGQNAKKSNLPVGYFVDETGETMYRDERGEIYPF